MNFKVKLYYFLKPLIPRCIQIFVRRTQAKKVLKNHADVWPINSEAHKRPELWNGWPGGKQFALVLIHDVETKQGYNDCIKLLKIEQDLGFRSSFNFVPERYKVQNEMIHQIKEQGFEVGVHGLKHDGKLFLSQNTFCKRLKKINFYLDTWKAVGFYSPSMHRDLEKILYMNILYDQSTFDTDPFEPEPLGVGTIFPFNVYWKGDRGGYIELPYTLPQDHTLFIILKERGIDIWKEKLDWISQEGGMALIKTHPDYMNFRDPERYAPCRYPLRYYIDFLMYIKERYKGLYWHVLPKQIAEYWQNEVSGQ